MPARRAQSRRAPERFPAPVFIGAAWGSSTPIPISMPRWRRWSRPTRGSPLCSRAAGRPPLRRRPGGFEGLASIVVSQQLSVASASAVWARLGAALDPFHHEAMRRARTSTLQRAGLSAPKIRTLKAVAAAIDAGRDRPRRARRDRGRRGPRPAHRAARHRALDRRHLSVDLPGPCRRLAGRRPRAAGGRAHRVRARQRGRRPRRWGRSPSNGGRGAGWRRACCGPIIAPSNGARRRRSSPQHPARRS